MASAPTEEALQQIVGAYDSALEAVGRADLERVKCLLDDADRALADLQDPEQDADAERDLRRRAVEGHARLVAAMDSSRREVLLQLQQAREGRKVLKTYGHRAKRVGTRLRSEG
jgi:hypothetical protein